jgi:hypothetical protein
VALAAFQNTDMTLWQSAKMPYEAEEGTSATPTRVNTAGLAYKYRNVRNTNADVKERGILVSNVAEVHYLECYLLSNDNL